MSYFLSIVSSAVKSGIELGLGLSIGAEAGTEYTVNLQPVFNATKFVGNTLQNMSSTALTIMTTPACKTAGCVGIQPLPYILPNQKPLDNTRYTTTCR